MKKSLFVFILLLLVPIVNAQECKDCYVNNNGVIIPESQYNAFVELGFNKEEINNMTQEAYNSYGTIEKIDKKTEEKYFRETIVNGKITYTILEEISKDEYDNEIPINNKMIIPITGLETYATGDPIFKVHETTYKKLTASIAKTSVTEPYKRMVLSSLEWKKLPSTRSYDIYATRVEGGGIISNSQGGSMTQKRNKFDSNCAISGQESNTITIPLSAWNTQTSGLGYSGAGYTGKLDTKTTVCTNDYGIYTAPITGYSSTLTYSASTSNQLTVYITYQHASSDVNFNDVYKSYTFNSSGLGGVVYFNNSSLRSAYDGMAGVSLTY